MCFGKSCRGFALEIKMSEKIPENCKGRKLIENNLRFQMNSKEGHK